MAMFIHLGKMMIFYGVIDKLWASKSGLFQEDLTDFSSLKIVFLLIKQGRLIRIRLIFFPSDIHIFNGHEEENTKRKALQPSCYGYGSGNFHFHCQVSW